MSKQKGRDYSTLLIWAAATVTVVRYAAAFAASDAGQIMGIWSEVITFLMALSGLAMGILDVFGGAYLFDGWRKTMPAGDKKWSFRFRVLTFFVFALISTGVMILVPFTVSRVTHVGMDSVLGNGGQLWFWALLVNLAPYLLIGGVAIGNQIVAVHIQEAPEPKIEESDRKVSGKFPNDWRKVLPYLTPEEVLSISQMSTAKIMKSYHLDVEKTARNWRAYAQAEVEKRGIKARVG